MLLKEQLHFPIIVQDLHNLIVEINCRWL